MSLTSSRAGAGFSESAITGIDRASHGTTIERVIQSGRGVAPASQRSAIIFGMPTDEAFAAVDAIFERFFTEKGAPGVAFGIVEDGRLVHAGPTARPASPTGRRRPPTPSSGSRR